VSRWLSWGLFGLTVALVPVALALGIAGELRGLELPLDRESMLALSTVACGTALLYGTVGLLIARGEPGNAIGWIFLGSAATLAAMAVAYGYADLALYGGEGWPAGVWLGWFANWAFIPAVFMAPCFVAQLFPTGKPLPGRWRWVLGASLAFAVFGVASAALEPGPIDPYPDYENPAALPGGGGDATNTADSLSEQVAAPLFFLASLLALVVRYRRSRGVERQQMKWLTFAIAVLVFAFVVSFAAGPAIGQGLVADALFLIGVAGLVFLPVAVAIAIRRYRLYEIDRVISRTLVYGALSLILGAAYAGLVLAGQAVFSSFAGGSNLAIAGSTLVVAALFFPARSRLQRLVERRFYRRRYDAQRTLETFGSRLRQETELETLTAELRTVVAETMQPSGVSLWLRREPTP
jgi:hypothetical protein